jgi:uncharacterized protein
MIEREITKELKLISKKMPVIAVIGPRQSGKTTLTRNVFKKHKYVTLENLSNRIFAKKDVVAFIQEHSNHYGMIIDEIQHVPELLSYIQVHVDEHKKPGFFIITGSQNFLINEAITQSLAGRVALFTLLPFSINELKKSEILTQKKTIEDVIFKGLYPRIYSDKLNPIKWYPDYTNTYIEKDVRSLKNITSLTMFKTFLGLCAGRIGQLLNITSLSNDCGITVSTTKSWLSILEASYIIFLLQPYHVNIGKRLVKSPKLYFYDTGLACSILEIESKEQLLTHYLRGNLAESLIISELLKMRLNQGLPPRLYFFRDKSGHEIDALITSGASILPVEIKAGKTISQDYFNGLKYWYSLLKSKENNGVVIYAGKENQKRTLGRILSWNSMDLLNSKSSG